MRAPFRINLPVPPLVPGEVHVRKIDLGAEISEPADDTVLSPDERARASRFRRPADRGRSIAARVALRTLLGEYAGAEPASLRFVAGPNGKPALAPGSADGAPCFNVAHSGRLVLLAFAACDVGIDVEEVRSGVEVEDLARRFLSGDEVAALTAVSPPDRDQLFFQIWTRKEAFLKAHGFGLSSPLTSFTTTAISGSPLASIRVSEGLPPGYLSDLELVDGYTGAVVTTAPTRVVAITLTSQAVNTRQRT